MINFVPHFQGMKNTFFVSIIFIFACVTLAGQSHNTPTGDLLESMRVRGQHERGVHVDDLIVAEYHKLISKSMKEEGVPGYRIRIFSESGLGAKEEQRRIRAKFLSLYPGIDAYNDYDEPYFKVYVGDCRTRSEALKLHDEVRKNFPHSIIIEDMIIMDTKD